MTTLYYSKLTPSAYAASSSAAGYPPANVGREDIGRPWRAANALNTSITLDYAASTLAAVFVEDTNCESIRVYADTGAGSVLRGTITTYADKKTGRRRGMLAVALAGVIEIILEFNNGGAATPTDGASYWRLGAFYAFSTASELPRNFDYGSSTRAIYPQIRRTLPNGKLAQASTGYDALRFSLRFERRYSQDVLELVRRARAATVGLSLDDPDYPEYAVPVFYSGEDLEEEFARPRKTALTVELQETT